MARRSRHLLALALAFAVAFEVASPTPALAQADAHTRAEEQFRQGREAQGKGDFRHALDLFRASQALEPGRGKLVNMAICEEKLGLIGSALRHLDEVLPQLPASDERLPIVQKRLAQLRPRAPMLRLELDAGIADKAHVKLDEDELSAAQLAGELPVDPGKHTVSVTAAGRADVHQDVELKEQEHRTLHLDAGAVLAVSPVLGAEAAKPEDARPGERRRLVGFVVGGAGAAGLVIGVGTGIASLMNHGSAMSACPTHQNCSQAVVDKASQGKALGIASTAAFVTGAALVGVGAYLVVSGTAAKPKATVGLVGVPGGARLEGWF